MKVEEAQTVNERQEMDEKEGVPSGACLPMEEQKDMNYEVEL